MAVKLQNMMKLQSILAKKKQQKNKQCHWNDNLEFHETKRQLNSKTLCQTNDNDLHCYWEDYWWMLSKHSGLKSLINVY